MAGPRKFSSDHGGEAVPAPRKGSVMTISPLAGKPAPKDMLVDLARLEREYFERLPNLDDPEQRVSFGVIGMHTFGASAP